MARRHRSLRLDDLKRISVNLKSALPFIVTPDWRPGGLLDEERLKDRLTPAPKQLALF